MYTIKCDGKILYSPRFVGAAHAITDAKLERGLNKAGSLEFTMPYGNAMYSSIQMLRSDITVEQDGKVIFKGRPLDSTVEFDRSKTITCEGALAFLNDGLVRPYDHKAGIKIGAFFTELISSYNSNASSNRHVYPGTFTHSDPDMMLYIERTDYSNTLTELQEALIDNIGGYLVTRYADDGRVYIDYVEEVTKRSSQELVFAKNLLDLEDYIDATAVFTTIIPLGAKQESGEYLTIKSVNDNKDYIEDTAARSRYGHITKVVHWDDIDDAATLKKLAQASLSTSVKMAISITAKAFDFHLLNVDTAALEYGTLVPITSPPHGLQKEDLILSDEELDLLDPNQSEYTLGVEGVTISSAAAKPDKKK